MDGKFGKIADFIKKQSGVIILAALLIIIVVTGNRNGKKEASKTPEPQREKTVWEMICEKNFPDTCGIAIVSDQDAPGAYCTGILGREYNAPILFTDDYEALKTQLNRLKPHKVFFATSKTRFDEVVSYVGWSGDSVLIDTDSTVNAATEIAANIKIASDQVFIVPYDVSKEVVAAISPVSSKKSIPIIAVAPDGFSDRDKSFIRNGNIKKAFFVGAVNENATGFLDETGVATESIDGTNAAEINGTLVRMFMAGSKNAYAADDAMQAVAAGALINGDAVLYLPEHIDATQIVFLRENGIKQLCDIEGDEDFVALNNNILKDISENEFLFDTEKYDGVVFISPHQDDETLYFSQMISKAVDEFGGENVYVILVSDGAASSVKKADIIKTPVGEIVSATGLPVSVIEEDAILSAFFSRARTNEMRDAIAALGVENELETEFFGDGKLSGSVDEIKGKLKERVEAKDGNMMVVTYSPYFDVHADHRATGQAVYELYTEDPEGAFGGAMFIVRCEEELNEGFLTYSSQMLNEQVSFITDQSYPDEIGRALEEYSIYNCPVDLIADAIRTEVQEANCSIAKAVMDCEEAGELRLAIGGNSVRDTFALRGRHIAQGCYITYIHKPFDIELYGGIKHE